MCSKKYGSGKKQPKHHPNLFFSQYLDYSDHMDLEEVVVPLSAEAALADPTHFAIFPTVSTTSELFKIGRTSNFNSNSVSDSSKLLKKSVEASKVAKKTYQKCTQNQL